MCVAVIDKEELIPIVSLIIFGDIFASCINSNFLETYVVFNQAEKRQLSTSAEY